MQGSLMWLEGTVDLKQGWFCWNLSLRWGRGVAAVPSPLTGCLLLYGGLGASCFSPCFSNQSEELCSKSQGVPSAPDPWVGRRDPLGLQGPDRASVPCSLPQPPFYCGQNRWGTPVGGWTGKGFSVPNAVHSDVSTVCCSACLSVSFHKFVLPCTGDFDKRTLHPQWNHLPYRSIKEFSSVQFCLKWWLLRNCYPVGSASWITLFSSLLNANLLLCS